MRKNDTINFSCGKKKQEARVKNQENFLNARIKMGEVYFFVLILDSKFLILLQKVLKTAKPLMGRGLY
jgi:hypothetical protein